MTRKDRELVARKMAQACIQCLTDEEFESLTGWSDRNLTCKFRFALEDAIKLVIASDTLE